MQIVGIFIRAPVIFHSRGQKRPRLVPPPWKRRNFPPPVQPVPGQDLNIAESRIELFLDRKISRWKAREWNYFISIATTFVSHSFLFCIILEQHLISFDQPTVLRCSRSSTDTSHQSYLRLLHGKSRFRNSRSATIPQSVLISVSQRERESKWGEGSSSISLMLRFI